jgi:phospholipase/carboxylesterase
VKYKTKGKPVVAGFSQGGALSFVVAVRHPEAVRAAIPVSGWLPTGLLPRPGAEVAPIRALHGGADTLVELDPTNEAVASLVDRGADASIEVFPRVGHAFTRQMQVSFFNLLRRAMSETDSSVEP